MAFRTLAVVAIAAMALLGGGARAEDAAAAANNYADKADWLCWPGRAGDACDVDLAATVVAGDGAMKVERFKADPHPAIDCFYVYPTVSTDPGVISTMAVELQERRVVEQQFARFASVCRLYAPVYRQFTLTALVARMQGKPLGGAAGAAPPQTGYHDVVDAWNYYLAHENHGRGVVLIGHSQGSGVLTQLIKNEIDGKPAQRLLVSAILMGTSLAVPNGGDVGGDFKTVRLCHASNQLGCVIAYASYRDDSPPPANAFLGRLRTPSGELAAACVNPADLAGGSGELKPYFASRNEAIVAAAAPPTPWVAGKTVTTPFVTLPGMLTAHCVSAPPFTYLAIHVNANPAGPRVKDIPGDVIIGGAVQKNWGLHLIDANLAMGNLVAIVRDEGEAWVAAKR
ncbi:MAG TPA: DUF3089 domain-containing protein [Caulobacteraceae bacterium]